MRKSVLVIGLDAFGLSVVTTLSKLNCDVIALDLKQEAVNKVINVIAQGIVGDSTDINVLKEIGAEKVDYAVVSIPGNIENSILTTIMLSELQVPKIAVKVDNPYHAKVAERVGATEVIDSEQSAGVRFARKILSVNVLDYYNLTNEYGIYEIKVGSEFTPKSLLELDTRNKYEVNVLLIIRDKKTISPKADTIINPNDLVIVISDHKNIHKFEVLLS